MKWFSAPKQNHYRQLYYIFEHKKLQWLKEKDLVKIQQKKLKPLIYHAYQNVPYYRGLFDSVGIKPQDIKTIKDLQYIPILTKEVVRNNFPDKIVAKKSDTQKCYIRSTTGSTGIPLKIAYSSKMEDYAVGLTFFVWSECGLRLTDRFVSIRHNGYLHLSDKNSLFKSLFQKMGIFRGENILIFNPIESILKDLKKSKPDVIYAYPSMLLLLSKEIKERNITGINPRIILTSGETLTDNDRNKIINSFKSNIYSIYGTEECSRLAFECKEHSGHHIISNSSIIEIVKGDKHVGEGEAGDIVVTSLFNDVMPLIRYKIGDIGTFTYEKCACGRGLPLIKSIEGRNDDFFTLPSGRIISPRTINEIGHIHEIKAYKTIQKAKDSIVIEVVKGKGFNKNTIFKIQEEIKSACLGEDVKVDVEFVKEIAKERTGKIRAIVSNVKEY